MHAHTRVHAYMSYVYNISLYNNYTKGVNCLVKSIIIRHDALTDVPAATLFFHIHKNLHCRMQVWLGDS